MQFDVAFRHMRSSPMLRSYAERKIKSRLGKLAKEPVWTDMIFSSERTDKVFRCYVYTGDGMSYHAKHSSEDMQKSVDLAMDKLASQLRRHHGIDSYHRDIASRYTIDQINRRDGHTWSDEEEDDNYYSDLRIERTEKPVDMRDLYRSGL